VQLGEMAYEIRERLTRLFRADAAGGSRSRRPVGIEALLDRRTAEHRRFPCLRHSARRSDRPSRSPGIATGRSPSNRSTALRHSRSYLIRRERKRPDGPTSGWRRSVDRIRRSRPPRPAAPVQSRSSRSAGGPVGSGPAIGDRTVLGKIEPTAEEQALSRLAIAGWQHLTIEPLAQWRWDHERDAVLAEDILERKAAAESQLAAQKQRDEYLSRLTLDDLRTRRFFDGWTIPPARAVRASRQLMSRTVERLLELGPGASEDARMAILQECIEGFNALNDNLGFIETDEREDICEEFEAVVHACGLGAHQDLTDRWRDW
jgi:hypothetical protein